MSVAPNLRARLNLSALPELVDLKAERQTLEDRLAKLEARRAQTSDEVFKRVSRDYFAQLQGLIDRALPLKAELRAEYGKLREELEATLARHGQLALDREELQLRRDLGEFDDEEFARRVAAIEDEIGAFDALKAEGEAISVELLAAFDSEADLHDSTTQRVPATPEPPAVAPVVEGSKATLIVEPPPPARPAPAPASPAPARPAAPPPAAKQPPASAATTVFKVDSRLNPTADSGATMQFRPGRLIPHTPQGPGEVIVLGLKPVIIGAAPEAQIRVEGPGVAAHHARIDVSYQGYTLHDLDSPTGTRVNGRRAKEQLLADEDTISIGVHRFVFRFP